MIRIVGVQRGGTARQEFVLLQNQGNLRAPLRGHLLATDAALTGADLTASAHLLIDDVAIPAGAYVVVTTGAGEPRWAKTKDMQLVYYAYLGREKTLWAHAHGAIHLLNLQHTYTEPREVLALV